MAYNAILGKILLVLSTIAFLYSTALLVRPVLTIWAENLWMVPVFLFGAMSLPYLTYSVRSYGEVMWRWYVRQDLYGEKLCDLMGEHVYHSMVLPSDCDVFNHMNNSRYSREADFARVRWQADTGFLMFQRVQRSYIILVAATVRYRRSLDVFQKFDITTKMIFWDDKHLYLQHKFITKDSNNSPFVNAITVAKMRVLAKEGTEAFLTKFLKTTPQQMQLTQELDHYMRYLESCSENLRNNTSAKSD